MCVCVQNVGKEREGERERERNVAIIIRYVKMTLLYVLSTIIRAAAMQKHTKNTLFSFVFFRILFSCAN